MKILDGRGREVGQLADAPKGAPESIRMNRADRRAAAVKLRRAAKARKKAA